MTPDLSPNAQAILLLTAPLIAGRGNSSEDLLSPGEYKRIARRMRDLQRQPADLLSPDASALLRECQPIIDETRMQRLLARGFLLSQVVERWTARAIWVRSRADAEYPRRLKTRLKEDAPAVLYGCGDINLSNTGGLAVVGSRDVDEHLIEYTKDIGHLVSDAGSTLISGGARGIDQAAMFSALEAGGKAVGVLADSLEKSALARENRDMLMGSQLVLISPYDPSAGFNVGNAMSRNKLIYALSDAALVINADFNKGGTWAGATEQLKKFRMVPLYVRSTGNNSAGVEGLRERGAISWPNPRNVDELKAILATAILETATHRDVATPSTDAASVSGGDANREASPRRVPGRVSEPVAPGIEINEVPQPNEVAGELQIIALNSPVSVVRNGNTAEPETPPADIVFATVRKVLVSLLVAPMKDVAVASALEVSTPQAKIWLRRLVDEGVLEEKKKPHTFIARQSRLFE